MNLDKLGSAKLTSSLYGKNFRPAKIYKKNGRDGKYYRCRGYYFYYTYERLPTNSRKTSIMCDNNDVYYAGSSLFESYVQNRSYFLMLELKGAL